MIEYIEPDYEVELFDDTAAGIGVPVFTIKYTFL